ncbi:maleylpyruvate isomerase N-terminal domain-containing protein [Asanoa hainanensis]|uniref:maleylpyruvate isomerase N-terminal domain-containing protein n=1 Tax=Asanoa hainanensis TaxID=560556 RepID=UPI0011802A33|nr:maleylpyruvate isomerase N-terminal domain-containing protein [Asanoa hainanensis]
MRLPFAPADYIQPLTDAMAGFAAIAATTDLDAPIALNKKWALAGLVRHLGGIHRWAAAIVETGKRVSGAPKPPLGADLARWYQESAEALSSAIAKSRPDSTCWNFTKDPRVTAFWYRRQLHETIIHGRDADAATGTIRAIPLGVAADGVDEVFTVMLPTVRRWGTKLPPRLTGPVLVHATDSGHRWLLTPTDDVHPAVKRQPGATVLADATVRATADSLLMALWGRATVAEADVTVDGDVEMARAFLDARLTP